MRKNKHPIIWAVFKTVDLPPSTVITIEKAVISLVNVAILQLIMLSLISGNYRLPHMVPIPHDRKMFVKSQIWILTKYCTSKAAAGTHSGQNGTQQQVNMGREGSDVCTYLEKEK